MRNQVHGQARTRHSAATDGRTIPSRPKPRGRRPSERSCALTDRQLQVITELGQGGSYDDVAERLALSPSTIRSHVTAALATLDVTTAGQAYLWCIRHGWVDVDLGDHRILRHIDRKLDELIAAVNQRRTITPEQRAVLYEFDEWLASRPYDDPRWNSMVSRLALVMQRLG